MITLKQEFQNVVVELISEDFESLRVPFRVFKESDEYDPRTGQSGTPESYDLEAIPLELQDAEKLFSNVTNDSIYMVAIKNGSTVKLDSSYQCELKGKSLAIQLVDNDSADAAWFFRLAR